MSNTNAEILITGGHSTPAFAVLDELKVRGYKNFVWVGEKYNQRGNSEPSQEYKRVSEYYKIPFINLKAGKLIRKWTPQTFVGGIIELFNLAVGFTSAFFIILKHKPDIVVSFGGFTAVPLVIWAKIFGRKVLTHEQTIVVGLANKIIAKYADRICVSWKQSLAFFPQDKVVLTGNPIRKEVFEQKVDITPWFHNDIPLVYITGGNQGAHEINARIFEIIKELTGEVNILHQTGNSTVTNDFKIAKEIENRMQINGAVIGQYKALDYVDADTIGSVLAKATVVVSRAGANTVQELLALGKMAVLIPIPWTSHDEQTKNAKLLEELGLGKRLIQSDALTSKDLLQSIHEILEQVFKGKDLHGRSLSDTSETAKKLVNRDAPLLVANEVEKLL